MISAVLAAAVHEQQSAGFAQVALFLAIILVVAKLGGHLASRLGQPSVLGELVAGIVLGNLGLLGWTALEPIKSSHDIDLLAQLGVLILLFQVGLESTVSQMLKVGPRSLLVAVVGVITPFALGWGVGRWLLPDRGTLVHVFLGAALTATSVGITARVLKDLGRSQSDEARIILGAAVIDDVLGLVVLAVVGGVIEAAGSGVPFSSAKVLWIFAKSLMFLVGALGLGVWLSPRLFKFASRLAARQVLLAAGLAFCFLLAWLAEVIGLAPIVGAFAAGLILEDVHYRDFVTRGEKPLEETIEPISSFLAPVFFVVMGARTDLRAFAQPSVWGLALALIAAAVAGKQACSLVAGDKRLDRLSVGLGMIPRGEVGLIFANIGTSLAMNGAPVIDAAAFSAIVMMVVATTLLTPPALKWSLGRKRSP